MRRRYADVLAISFFHLEHASSISLFFKRLFTLAFYFDDMCFTKLAAVRLWM